MRALGGVKSIRPISETMGLKKVSGGFETFDPDVNEIRFFQDYEFMFGKYQGQRFSDLNNPSYLAYYLGEVVVNKVVDADYVQPVVNVAEAVIDSGLTFGALSLNDERVEYAKRRYFNDVMAGRDVALFAYKGKAGVLRMGTLMAYRRLRFDGVIQVGLSVYLDSEIGLRVDGLDELRASHDLEVAEIESELIATKPSDLDFDMDDLSAVPF